MKFTKTAFRATREVHHLLDESDPLYNKRCQVHGQLQKFLYEGIYTNHRYKSLILDCVEKADRTGKPYEKTIVLGTKYKSATVRKLITDFSDDFYKFTGYTPDKILKILDCSKSELDNIQSDIAFWGHANISLMDMFSAEQLEVIENLVVDDDCGVFALDECKKEIAILHWFSLPKFRQALCIEEIDMDKVVYLLKVVQSKGTAENRALMGALLCEDLVAMAENEEEAKLFSHPLI